MKNIPLAPETCDLLIDENVTIQNNVTISDNCKSLKIGFGSFIGRDTYIDAETLEIGEYTTIHHGSIIQGEKVVIGHNCWFGHYSMIDGTGGCFIGNNVGVGAHSQLWSHMKFGDVLEGCRFNSQNKLIIEDDVWFVGHSIVGPIKAEKKSLLMTGSLAVKDMKENKIYSGNPAKLIDSSEGQFIPKTKSAKEKEFISLVNGFNKANKFKIEYKLVSFESFKKSLCLKGISQFDITNRLYMPTRETSEINFIKFMLYDKAKFIPRI
jgi:acetyltransferase-like isoleucine patch superfamily enzyme|tara:strand:- start:117 stop:914 length:798 start_codon:yes stop_codon:yes gene_type:complete